MRPHPALLREPDLTPALAAAAGGAAAFALAFAGSAVAAWCGPLDRPGARTSHDAPTVTSGGVAVVLAACAGLAVAAWAGGGALGSARGPVLVLAWATMLGLVGALDDLGDHPALLKLAAMALAAAGLVWGASTPELHALVSTSSGAALLWTTALLAAAGWLLLAVNAVNFMDGADGLVAGALAAAFAALAWTAAAGGQAAAAAAAAAACAACAGFLPWNLGGRLFQGDAGALFAGFAFAGLHLTALPSAGALFGPLALAPLLTDVLLTLLRRARRGAPLMTAHREHLYQRWLQATGRPHAALAWRAWTLVAACALWAALLARAPAWAEGAGAAGAFLLLAGGWTALSARVDARLADRA